MTTEFGRHYVAIPGPSVIPDRVLQAMHKPAPNIYSKDMSVLANGIFNDLKSIACTKSNAIIYIANGHGMWEASISNILNRGDRILVLSTGIFATGWGSFAKSMGINVEEISFGRRNSIDVNRVADRLRKDTDHDIKAIFAVHVDTSTSVRNDIASLSKAIQSVNHPALLAIDCIASLGMEQFEMDKWGVDVAISASQKGLMTPPGLGFLFFNERARKRGKNANLRTNYWCWERRLDPEEFYMRFCGTAPTHHLFALREALDMINEEGLTNTISRHKLIASMIWSACDAWSTSGPLTLNIQDKSLRSHAVTAITLGSPYGRRLQKWVERHAGLTLGIGLGMATPKDPHGLGFFRIGHMGHVNANMILGALGSIEAGLHALSVPRGKGALDAAASVITDKDG